MHMYVWEIVGVQMFVHAHLCAYAHVCVCVRHKERKNVYEKKNARVCEFR